jgi:hypothetical protein
VSSVDTLVFQRAGVVFWRYRVPAINVTTAERSLLRHRSLFISIGTVCLANLCLIPSNKIASSGLDRLYVQLWLAVLVLVDCIAVYPQKGPVSRLIIYFSELRIMAISKPGLQ